LRLLVVLLLIVFALFGSANFAKLFEGVG
jgi:hypothetical protein